MLTNKIKILLLYLIPFFVYTQGFWERFTPVPAELVLEICIWAISLVAFRPKFNKKFLLLLAIIFVGIISASATNSFIEFAKYIRYFIYTYIIYDILKKTVFSSYQKSIYIKYLLSLIILQGVASVYQLFIVGYQVEGYVGFMSSIGGTTATTFALFIVSSSVLYYIFAPHLKKYKLLLLLLLIVCGCLVGYSSGKRAIYFLIPLFILCDILISLYILKGKAKIMLLKKTVFISLLLMVAFPFFISGIKNSGGLNYDLTGNEGDLEVIINAYEYAQKYESAESGGTSIGRSNSTTNILDQAFSTPDYFLFGSGFGSIKDERITYSRDIGYGFVGLSRDVFSGGVILALLCIILYLSYIWEKRVKGIFFAYQLLISLIFLVIHLGYSSDFFVSLKINFLVMFILSLINTHKISTINK